jgi:hypothetical protein
MLIKDKRTALIVMEHESIDSPARIKLPEALMQKRAYDAYVHYIYPAEGEEANKKARFLKLLETFDMHLANKMSRVDLFVNSLSFKFVLEALQQRTKLPKVIFENLFLLPGDQTGGMNEYQMKLILAKQGKVGIQNLLKNKFVKSSYSVFHNYENYSPPNQYTKSVSIHETVANKSAQLSSPIPLVCNIRIVFVNDCKEMFDEKEFAAQQEWFKEIPDDERQKLVQGKRVGIILHGMNNTASEAYQSFAKVSFAMKENYDIFIYYIWPGEGVLPHYSYNNAGNPKLIKHYQALLTGLKSAASSLDVIAHSMGNRFTLQTLKHIASDANQTPVLDNFFMVAPAVPNTSFIEEQSLYYAASKLINHIFVLWTELDEAMPFYRLLISPSASGMGTGVANATKNPANIMAINLTDIVGGHSLSKFVRAFPLISKLASHKLGNPTASMQELYQIVTEFLNSNGLRLKKIVSQYIDQNDDGTIFELPMCVFKNNPDQGRFISGDVPEVAVKIW